MLKAGILGIWRCVPETDPTLTAWSMPLLLIGLFGALYAAALGLCAGKSKAVLAWSSVSQMGWLLMVLALAWSLEAPSPRCSRCWCCSAYITGWPRVRCSWPPGWCTRRLPRPGWLLLVLPALAIMGRR